MIVSMLTKMCHLPVAKIWHGLWGVDRNVASQKTRLRLNKTASFQKDAIGVRK